jgi:hypothetical protein
LVLKKRALPGTVVLEAAQDGRRSNTPRGEEERMNQDRTDKRLAQDRRGQSEPHEHSARGADDGRDESRRKPSTIEQREWRGEGVCGDRHTD